MSKKKNNELTYVYHANAICITMYTIDGSPLTPEAQEQFENAAWEVAKLHGVLTGLANT
jgi:hypothetical protein